MKITTLSAFLVVLLILPTPILAQKNYLIIDGKRYELAPGPSYYDTHPEERARDAATQANKPLMDMRQQLIEDIRMREQGYGGGIHRDHPSPSSPPPAPSGAIDVGTGQFYPGVPGGIINPNTGQFLPDVGGGYIDPTTGRFIPKR
jgi:hypothetical protein